jgi:hypothetical protein
LDLWALLVVTSPGQLPPARALYVHPADYPRRFRRSDWRRTDRRRLPPTVQLTGEIFGRERSRIVFGWEVAVHQVRAALAAATAGAIGTSWGSYAWPLSAPVLYA